MSPEEMPQNPARLGDPLISPSASEHKPTGTGEALAAPPIRPEALPGPGGMLEGARVVNARNTAPIEEPPFQMEAWRRDIGGDLALLREIALLFFTDSPRMSARIGAALRGRDLETLSDAVHKLKGSSAAFGPNPVHELAKGLETRARRGGDWDESEALHAELINALEALKTAIAGEIQRGGTKEDG